MSTISNNSINSNSLIETLYSGLFEPFALYEQLANQWPRQLIHLLYAAGVVFWVSAMSAFCIPTIDQFSGISFWFLLEVFVASFIGVLMWFLTALSFSALAYCFRSQGKLSTILILTGYAMLPWVLLGPLVLLKQALGVVGLILYLVGFIGLWVWSTILFLVAIQKTYALSFDRVLLISVLPLMLLGVGVFWLLSGFGVITALFV